MRGLLASASSAVGVEFRRRQMLDMQERIFEYVNFVFCFSFSRVLWVPLFAQPYLIDESKIFFFPETIVNAILGRELSMTEAKVA
ncbi:hypothetical protein Bca4012_096192 [Brassica carinata]